MERSSLYRKSSMERIQSPEQLTDYLRVTNPAVWVLLVAVVVLLVGLLIWSSFTYIGSFAEGSATVEGGVMTVTFDDDTLARNVEAGMIVTVGETSSTITSVGRGVDGAVFARAETALSDGEYAARVSYRQTQILQLLFN